MSAIQLTTSNSNTLVNGDRTTVRDSSGIPYQVVEDVTNGDILLLGGVVDGQDSRSSQNELFGTNGYMGQSFTCSTSVSVSKVSFRLFRSGSPTGSAYAKLYSHSGTYGTSSVPGTLLGTSDALDVTTIPNSSFTDIVFTFSTPVSLDASTYYVVGAEFTSGDASNKINYGVITNAHDGNSSYYSASNWVANASYDLTFMVYGSYDKFKKMDDANKPATGTLGSVSACIDSTDIIHIAYCQQDTKSSNLFYVTYSTLTKRWDTPTELVSDLGNDTSAMTLYSAIAIDANDVPHIAFTGAYGKTGTDIQYINKVGGSWNSIVEVYGETVDALATKPSISIDLDNKPFIAYEYDTGTLTGISGAIGNTNNATSFTIQSVISGVTANGGISTAVTNDGRHLIGYSRTGGTSGLSHHAYGLAWTFWTAEVTASTGNVGASIVPVGNKVYHFHEKGSTGEIAYDLYDIDTDTWDGQTILETTADPYNSVKAKWGFWVDNDSQGSLKAHNTYIASTGGFSWIQGGTGLTEKQGQIFVFSDAITLYGIAFSMYEAGTCSDNVVCKLYSGGWESTLLGTSGQLLISDFPLASDPDQTFVFYFSTPIDLSAGTYYAVLERTGSRDTVNFPGANRTLSTPSNPWGGTYVRSNGTWSANTGSLIGSIIALPQGRTPSELDYAFVDETASPDVWWNTLSLVTLATFVAKVYNGSTWDTLTASALKYYTGSVWQAPNSGVKVWDGTQWRTQA